MITASAMQTSLNDGAAAVAAACVPAVTTAEIQGLADLMGILARRPDLLQNALQLSGDLATSAKNNIDLS